jgi:23S rRNA (cytidine1920-2'-O)/16S rRNA (cytidine1409-2'-O)-methyltransferase
LSPRPYVSRGGEKLAAALDAFQIDPTGWCCADLGSHVGGFVDCLLQRGARQVYAIDTCYGTLAWKLRRDARVVVLERTNALHVSLPEAMDLVTIDVGWTRQRRILPAAWRLLRPGGVIITLIKPHYEAPPDWLSGGVLPDDKLEQVVARVLDDLKRLGIHIERTVESPLRGSGGNREVLGLIRRAMPPGRHGDSPVAR